MCRILCNFFFWTKRSLWNLFPRVSRWGGWFVSVRVDGLSSARGQRGGAGAGWPSYDSIRARARASSAAVRVLLLTVQMFFSN